MFLAWGKVGGNCTTTQCSTRVINHQCSSIERIDSQARCCNIPLGPLRTAHASTACEEKAIDIRETEDKVTELRIFLHEWKLARLLPPSYKGGTNASVVLFGVKCS